MIPVEPAPDTVLVPLVAAWLAGLAGAEVALRTGRVLLGYLPPALLYAGALYVVGPNADPALWPTMAFVAAAARRAGAPRPATGATRRRPDRRQLDTGGCVPRCGCGWRPATAAGLVVVVAAGVLLGPVVAGQVDGRPVDPRRYVEPPQVESLDENPLIRISGWALHPEQVLLELRSEEAGFTDGSNEAETDAGGTPVRIRLAVLSDYDGVTWQVGGDLPQRGPDPAAGRAGARARILRTVRQEITIAELSGRLLPAVATPQQVSGARVAYDAQTGTLIRPEGLTPGLRYEVISTEERPDPNLLGVADVPAGDGAHAGAAGRRRDAAAAAGAGRAARRRQRRAVRAGGRDRGVPRRALPGGRRRPQRPRLPQSRVLPVRRPRHGRSARHLRAVRRRVRGAGPARRAADPRGGRLRLAPPATARSAPATPTPGRRCSSTGSAGWRSIRCPATTGSRARWRRTSGPSRRSRRPRRRRRSRASAPPPPPRRRRRRWPRHRARDGVLAGGRAPWSCCLLALPPAAGPAAARAGCAGGD